ncbi:ABC transporter substrate-binding protein [Pseudobdellovibrio exovorus]|uniref:Peptide ABC transporter periplasmic protein n=1 Tax=Pseudobdellovibrio exovorus JSS TaxID=1184267 RepID=M4VAM3_9BACT|nr:ABC transporter substrate-binding protein [Pseudobdellovibrio exovorus]AGH96452.1 peptide ABC transporter periplasmic protein [Pseudobdellovibrio exovorus JSS]
MFATAKCILAILVGFSVIASTASAVEVNAKAPQGGVLNYHLDFEPESIHPIMKGDMSTRYYNRYVQDSLCDNDYNTWAYTPRLAESWTVSPNGLEFTFKLRKGATFHNGDPVTAADVKFSLEAIRDPKHEALSAIPYFETFTKIDVIDTHTIKFTAKEKYFQNLGSLCGFYIIPKSVYGDINKSIKLLRSSVGAGPYQFVRYDRGQMIVIKKFDNWYGKDVPALKGYFNFAQINMKVTKDDNILNERLKKGDLDYAEIKSTDALLKITGKPFKPVFKSGKFTTKAVQNEMPKSYGYIGFNFVDPILKDKSVRLAFAHLVNRAEINQKFAENLNNLATSPVPVGTKQSPDRKPIEFSPAKAKELLTKAGWADADKNGVLEKTIDGKKTELRLTMIYANKDSEKQWTIVKEDCRKAGIILDLKLLEWNSFIKTIDEKKMQLWAMGWGAGDVESDPKQIWHSSSIGTGGSNFGSYKNAEVDKLIDQGRSELDQNKRNAIFKRAYTLIADDVPYVFLFNRKYEYYAVSDRVGTPGDTFKYDFGYRAWWSAQP